MRSSPRNRIWTLVSLRCLYGKTLTTLQWTTSTSSLSQGVITTNGRTVPDESHLGAHNTDKVDSGFPTSQERGHGSGRPSRNSGAAVYRNIYGGASFPGATKYRFNSRCVHDRWWRHGSGFGFPSDYVFRGADDYAGAANY